MNSQQLLFINLIIIVIVALFFNVKRLKRKQQPTRVTAQVWPPTEQAPEILEAAVIEIVPEVEKKERIYFVYNAHEWDVFEVLGLPPGVALDIATRHYQELIKKSDPSTFEFYDAAYSSLLKFRKIISK